MIYELDWYPSDQRCIWLMAYTPDGAEAVFDHYHDHIRVYASDLPLHLDLLAPDAQTGRNIYIHGIWAPCR